MKYRVYHVGMVPTHLLSLNECNSSELPNTDVLSLFRQTTCSASASNTLKVRKIHSYSDSRKIVKTPIVHIFFFFLFFVVVVVVVVVSSNGLPRNLVLVIALILLLLLLLLLLLQFKWPTVKLGVSNCSNSFMKIIHTGACRILDTQNLHSFSQCRQTPGVSVFRHRFLVWSHAEHVKLVLQFCPVFVMLFRSLSSFWLRCSFVSVSLND